jgi:hypothetical protein
VSAFGRAGRNVSASRRNVSAFGRVGVGEAEETCRRVGVGEATLFG